MPEMVLDTEIYPRIIKLSECLAEKLNEAAVGDYVLVISPEGAVVMDYCGGDDCGQQAWIRIVDAGPYDEFPDPPEGPVTCLLPIMYQIEVGFAHCAPQADGRGNPPTVEAQLAAFQKQTVAMTAIRRAIQCCMKNDDAPFQLGAYQPLGDEGGVCLMAVWTFIVGDRRF